MFRTHSIRFYFILLLLFIACYTKATGDNSVEKKLTEIGKVLDTCASISPNILEELKSIEGIHPLTISAKKYVAKAFFYEGLCFSIIGDFGKSLVAYKKARTLFQDLKMYDDHAKCNMNIGVLYIHIEDYRNAIRFFDLNKLLLSKDLQAKLSYLIGYCLIHMNDYLQADKIFFNALSIHKSYDKLHYEILLSQVDIKIEQRKINAANALIDSCILYFEKVHLNTALFLLKIKQAKLEAIKHNYNLSYELSYEAYSGLLKLNDKLYLTIAANAVAYYASKLNDYKTAYTFSQIYHDIRDSLSNENNRWSLNMMQAELVLTEKENKIKVLEKEKTIEKEKLFYQQLFTIGALLALLVVAFLLFFAVKNFRLSKKQNNIISLQKDKLETQVKLVNNKNLEILSSINYASRLQSAIVNPHQFFTNIFPNSFIFYQPKDIVAGDFYWCEKIENKVFFAAADCTGHGVPGALVSVVCATALNRTLYEYEKHEPGEILDTTRQLIIETFSKSKSGVMDGMDISFCVLDTDTNQVTWAGANNPLWIYKSASQELLEYKPNKQPIGNWENATPFTSHVIQLEAKDVVYLFTDGFQDQFGTDDVRKPNKKFKPAGMRKMLQSIATLAAEEQYQRVQHTFETWKGDTDQIDDVTLIGICIS